MSGGIPFKRWDIFTADYLIVALLLIITIALWIVDASDGLKWLFSLVTYLMTYSIAFFELSYFYKKKYGQDINKILFHFSFFSVILVVVLLTNTYGDIRTTTKGKYFGTKIFTKDSTYISDTTHYYIGKTEKFYFIHNTDSTNMVIPEREVFRFDLKINAIQDTL